MVSLFVVGALVGCGDGGGAPRDAGGVDGGALADAGREEEDAGMAIDSGPALVPRVGRAYVGGHDGELVVHAIDLASGALTETSRATVGGNASFAAMDPTGRFLYAVNEADGEVVAFSVAPDSGALTRLNAQSSEGGGPTHVSVDATGAWVLVANYGGGTVAVLPARADGSLGAAADTAAPGRNAHQILTDPSNRFALVPCLGSDRVVVLALDVATGALDPRGDGATAAGAGPRHLAFGADGTRVYVTNELDSTAGVFAFDAATGALTPLQTLPTLPAGFGGANTTAEIAVHPSGRTVYVSNRGHDSIAVFAIGADGRLEARGHALLEAGRPRSFAIDPSGTLLLAGAQADDEVVAFTIAADGSLTRGAVSAVPSGATFVGVFAVPRE